ncbi:MAG: PD-(D/E)XK nuclease family protein [Leeuwenhoekiella sp.]
MNSFIKDTVTKILLQQNSLRNLCLVLPSVRAGIVVKEEIIRQLDGQIAFLPNIIGIEHLIQDMAGLQSLPNAQLLLEFYSVFLEQAQELDIKDPDSFWEFLGWGSSLINDFNELDRYLVEPNLFFNHFSAVKEIDHWSHDTESKLTNDFLKFWKSLSTFYSTITRRLKDKGVGYQGMLYRHACSRCNEYLESNTTQYVFMGFNALNKAEQQILQQFVGDGRAQIYWDLDEYFAKDSKSSVSHFIRGYYDTWPIYRETLAQWSSTSFNTNKNITVTGVSQQVGQAKRVGGILADMTLEQRSKTAIVLGDEALLLPLLNALPADVGPINVTMGLPLKLIPDAGFFEVLLQLYGNSSGGKYAYKDIQEFFSHGFAEVLFQKDVNEILTHSISTNAVYLTSEEIQRLGTVSLTHKVFAKNVPEVSDFINLVLFMLKELSAAYKSQNSWLELEYVFRFTTLFQQLEGLQREFGHFDTLRALRGFYEMLLAQETLDFRGDPYKGLQIMGVLESRVLDFEHVIVTSLNEGVLPSGKSQGSNIPFDVKLNFDLPTYREKDAIYSYHFFRLLQRAQNAYLLYNNEPGSMDSAEKSRFLLQLEAAKNAQYNLKNITVTAPIHLRRKTMREVQKDDEVITILKRQAATGFSPSALLLYILNPLAFYQRYVLNIKEVDAMEETVAFNTLGTIVHETLEVLYTPLLNQVLNVKSITPLKGKVESEVTIQFGKNYNLKNIKQGKNLVIYKAACQFVYNFLEWEQSQIESGAEIVVKSLEYNDKVPVSGFDFPVFLRGSIDRQDTINGKNRILDYKTGKVTATDLKFKEWELLFTDYKKGSKAFQVLCYALLLSKGENISETEAGIISFKNLKSGFLPFTVDKKTVVTSEILQEFQEHLMQLIAEILDINQPFTEKESPFK